MLYPHKGGSLDLWGLEEGLAPWNGCAYPIVLVGDQENCFWLGLRYDTSLIRAYSER